MLHVRLLMNGTRGYLWHGHCSPHPGLGALPRIVRAGRQTAASLPGPIPEGCRQCVIGITLPELRQARFGFLELTLPAQLVDSCKPLVGRQVGAGMDPPCLNLTLSRSAGRERRSHRRRGDRRWCAGHRLGRSCGGWERLLFRGLPQFFRRHCVLVFTRANGPRTRFRCRTFGKRGRIRRIGFHAARRGHIVARPRSWVWRYPIVAQAYTRRPRLRGRLESHAV